MGSVGAVRAGGGGNNIPLPSRAELIDRVRDAEFVKHTLSSGRITYRAIVDGVGRGAVGVEPDGKYKIVVYSDDKMEFIDIPSMIEKFDSLESAERAVKMWLEYIARGEI